MEPDVSIETSCMIRVAVLPIGSITIPLFRDYTSMLVRHYTVSLSSISSFYTEHQKSPFAHQPWDSGSLRFKFMVGGSPPSPWEDFQSNRKIFAVIGICHCPSSPDLHSVMDQFVTACKSYSSSVVQRCFAFCPGDSQLEDESFKGSNLILFPPADRQTQEFHLQTMMQDIAASLLMEFEKSVLQAESGGTILKTPLDSQASLSSEEVIKAKKRRLGRAQKTIGDYCLLAGSPVDANAHYSTSLELARLTGDFFWYAGAMEGSVCALLIDQMGQRDQVLDDEVKYRYNSVILHYRKSFIQDNAQRVSPLSFELEATLKLARYLCRKELAKEVVDLLTAAADGAKSLIDASDRLILYIEIARLFGTLGYHRKAAFFSRQVAQLYLQQENRLAAISSMQVLAMTTKAYRVQSRASTDHALYQENGQNHADGGKAHHNWIVSLFESQWSSIQMVVLREILLSAVRGGDPLTAWSAAARLLRSYYPLITPAGQNGLASALSNASERLPSGTRCADPALPFIRLHSFPLHSSQQDIVKRNHGRDDWWAGAAPSGPFIYTPFSKGEANQSSKQELIWVVGEAVQVLVELANPCGFDLKVDSIYLSVHSGNFDAFPISVSLPPNSSKVIALAGIPTEVGSLKIPGCIVHCFGVITEHYFKDVDNLLVGAAQGLVLSDPFRCCGSPKLKNVTVPNISVVPPLPLFISRVVGSDGAIILYEGEIREVQISLANAGTVPIEQAHISLSGKNQDSIQSIAYEILKSSLPLKPGAEVRIPVTLKAWQLGLSDLDAAPGKNISGSTGRQLKDGSSPVLLIHYAGPLAYSGDASTNGSVPPGRRLVVPLNICVLQGLSLVKARLLSMEIPAHVGENHSKIQVETSSTEESPRTDRFMKIDPYRGSWGLRFLELELSNPTDVVFEIGVSVNMEDSNDEENPVYDYPKTRIDRDYTARVLIPLEHFKLPVLDGSFLVKESQMNGTISRRSSFSEKSSKAELNASIKNLRRQAPSSPMSTETLNTKINGEDSTEQLHSPETSTDLTVEITPTEKRKREETETETETGQQQQQPNPLWKTSLCSYFRRNDNSCSHGDSCRYAHGESELRPRPDNTWDPTSERAKKIAKKDDDGDKSENKEEEKCNDVMMTEALDNEEECSSSGTGLSKCLVNLPMKWSSDNLRCFLKQHDVTFKSAKKKKGMVVGFVTFENPEQVKSALKELNGKLVGNKNLKVGDVIPRPFERKGNSAISSSPASQQGEKQTQTGDSLDSTKISDETEAEDPLSSDSVLKGRSVRDVVTPLANVPYADQLEQKKSSLMQTLKKLTRNARKACPNGVSLPEWILKSREIGGQPCKLEGIIDSPLIEGYRNKCEFSVGYSVLGKPTVGFLLGNFREGVTAVEEPVNCPNVSGIACKYAAIFQDFLQQSTLPIWNRLNNTGFWRQLTVREGRMPGKKVKVENSDASISEVMLIVQVCTLALDDAVVNDEFQSMAKAFAMGASSASPTLPLTVLVVQDHTGISNVAPADAPLRVLPFPKRESYSELQADNAVAEAKIHDFINGLRFCISPTAFFQVNTLAAEKLYSLAGDWASLGPDTLLFDVCCGTGTIGLTLANRVGMVVGIEMNASAVSDAQRNAEINGIKNCRFICGKAEDVMGSVLREYLTSPPKVDGIPDIQENTTSTEKTDSIVNASETDEGSGIGSATAPIGNTDSTDNTVEPEGKAGLERTNGTSLSESSAGCITESETQLGKSCSSDNLTTSVRHFKNVVAIVDPPRVGLHPTVIKLLRTNSRLRRLVYISCNPESLVANAIELCTPSPDEAERGNNKNNRGWRNMSSASLARHRTKSMPSSEPFQPVKAMAVDLFPHTSHCELVMLLER